MTLAEDLSALPTPALERLWGECEEFRITGVLADEAELRRMVGAAQDRTVGEGYAVLRVALSDGLNQVTYEVAKRSIPVDAVLEWHHIVGVVSGRGGSIGGLLADLPLVLADRDHLRFLVEDRAKRLAREGEEA
jgi:hypothetical protein